MFHKWVLAIFLCFAFACGSSSSDESDRIVVAGNAWNGNDCDTLVLRYEFDGTPDPVFGDTGSAIIHLSDADQWGEAVAIAPDEKIVVAGGMDGETDDVLTMRLIGSSLLF